MRWGVFKVFDSGRAELLRSVKSAAAADRLAGEMRDRMSDSAVGVALADGWNYLPRRLTSEQAARARVRNYIASHGTSYQSRTQRRIAAEFQRLTRKGVERRT